MSFDLKVDDYPLLIDSINWELDLLEELGWDTTPRYYRLLHIKKKIQAFNKHAPEVHKRTTSFIPRLRLSKLKPPSREFPYYFSENGVTVWLNKEQYWDLRKAFLGKAKEGDPAALKRLEGFGPLPKK